MKLKSILMELKMNETTSTAQIFEPTKDSVLEFGNNIKSAIEGMVPMVGLSTGFLNHYDYIYIKIILQPREKWPNGIQDNAPRITMHITSDGTMEMSNSHLYVKSKRPNYVLDRLPIKFRKTKIKNEQDAIVKITKLIKDIENAFIEAGEPLG